MYISVLFLQFLKEAVSYCEKKTETQVGRVLGITTFVSFSRVLNTHNFLIRTYFPPFTVLVNTCALNARAALSFAIAGTHLPSHAELVNLHASVCMARPPIHNQTAGYTHVHTFT